jgi:hypothetical protein
LTRLYYCVKRYFVLYQMTKIFDINLDYLHNAIHKKDIDTIFDIMCNHPNTFVVEPILKTNPLIPSYKLKQPNNKTIMYRSRFLACVALYAFQVYKEIKREDSIKELGKLIFDLSSRRFIESENKDIVEFLISLLQYSSDSRVDEVFAYYADRVSKQDNEQFKYYLLSNTLHICCRSSWSKIVYTTFQKSIKQLFNLEFLDISIEQLIYRRIEHIEIISKLCKDLTFPSHILVWQLISFSRFTKYLNSRSYIDSQLYIALEYSNVRYYIETALQVFNHCTENDLKEILMHPDTETKTKYVNDIKTFEAFYLNFIYEENERKRIASEILETSLLKDIVNYVVLKYLKLRD